jgi:hypothetical protein
VQNVRPFSANSVEKLHKQTISNFYEIAFQPAFRKWHCGITGSNTPDYKQRGSLVVRRLSQGQVLADSGPLLLE